MNAPEKSIAELHTELGHLLRKHNAIQKERCVDCGARSLFGRCEACEAQYQREQAMYRRGP